MDFAIIKTGGKQYLVKEGESLVVETLPKKVGEKVEFEVMLVAAGDGVKVGKPTVKGAKVSAEVLEHAKGDKTRVIKYHRKARFKKVYGHRQPFSKIKIEKISA